MSNQVNALAATGGKSKLISPAARLLDRVREYDAFHRTQGNRALHFLGIPSFIVGVLGLLAQTRLVIRNADPAICLDGGLLLLTLVALGYGLFEWKASVAAGAAGLGCHALGAQLPIWALQGLVFAAAAAHIIGHRFFERNSPAVFANPSHMFIAPLWLLGLWTNSLRETEWTPAPFSASDREPHRPSDH